MSSLKIFLLKNTFKVALQYLFNVFILLNIVFNLKLNFKLKIVQKMNTFKRKPGKIKKKKRQNSKLRSHLLKKTSLS